MLWRRVNSGHNSLRLERGMEGVETLEAFGQDLPVAQSEPCLAFEHAVQPHALRTLEFLILHVRVVNHFGDGLH